MMNQCFLEQAVTTKIIEFVTGVCSECYREFHEGEKSYYDSEECRYMCEECAQKICKQKESQLYSRDTEEKGMRTLSLF